AKETPNPLSLLDSGSSSLCSCSSSASVSGKQNRMYSSVCSVISSIRKSLKDIVTVLCSSEPLLLHKVRTTHFCRSTLPLYYVSSSFVDDVDLTTQSHHINTSERPMKASVTIILFSTIIHASDP